jgi:hypothetical protein
VSQPIRLSGVDSEPPPVEPYRWGLLSVAHFPPSGAKRWEIAGIHYQQDACGPGGGIWLDPCYVKPLQDGEEYPLKTITLGVQDVVGYPFMVYDTAQCGVGLDDDAAQRRAQARLTAREQYWVEQRFAETELSEENPSGLPVEVLAGGTAVSLAEALGALEQGIAAEYGGIGVIHAPRHTAPAMKPFLRERSPAAGGTSTESVPLHTELDNLIAFGAGYSGAAPDGDDAPAGQVWLYATGPVQVWRSDIQVRSDFDTRRNLRLALAERAYLFTADCLRLAVLAQLPGSP